MSRMKRLFILLVACLLAATGVAREQKPTELRVAVLVDPPFVSLVGDDYQGAAISLWQAIAADNHWAFRYVPTGNNVDQTITALQAGQYDIFIGPISVNQHRIEQVDYSRPYFINRVGLIISKQTFQFKSIREAFFTPVMGILLLCLISSFVLYLHFFWYFERGLHPEIPMKYRNMISQGLLLHVFKKGFSGMPMTFGGRLTLLLWLFGLAILFSSLNATLTASLTTLRAKEHDSISDFSDLTRLNILGVEGHAEVTMAQNKGLTVHTMPSLEAGVKQLIGNKHSAMVYDSLPAQVYLNSRTLDDLMLSAYTLGQEEFSFAFPYGSPYAKAINITIVKLQDSQMMSLICEKYLGDQAKYCEL